MKWNFDFSEFVTLDDPEFGEQTFIPEPDVTDNIVKNFMVPLQVVRQEIGAPVYILSCYRPLGWELKKGRSGDSQHCFKDEGACDVTAKDLRKLFISLSLGNWTRIAFYPEQKFFHIDRKSNEKQFFINRDEWELSTKDEILQTIA